MTAHEANASDRERRDLVTGQVMDESRLIRFVAAPDGGVAPDLGRKLPGRGLWVAADRVSVETATKKNLFARAARAPIKAAPELAATVETLLLRRCLDQLGLARREGVLISGFEKTAQAIRSGSAAWVIEASDGASDGRGKILGLARHAVSLRNGARVCGVFASEDLSLALGLENVIHAVLLTGGRADRFTAEMDRLAGFRPLRPQDWDHFRKPEGAPDDPRTRSGDGPGGEP
jgi:predicted RNA-binding protein YlxR (DUF448 family)